MDGVGVVCCPPRLDRLGPNNLQISFAVDISLSQVGVVFRPELQESAATGIMQPTLYKLLYDYDLMTSFSLDTQEIEGWRGASISKAKARGARWTKSKGPAGDLEFGDSETRSGFGLEPPVGRFEFHDPAYDRNQSVDELEVGVVQNFGQESHGLLSDGNREGRADRASKSGPF